MSTRRGKIARLPHAIRNELNQRLHNGETENTILPWLNALPETQAVLAAQFTASPVTQQNLSNWRLGGYLDWLKEREHHDLVREVALDAGEFNSQHGTSGIAKNLSVVLLANFAASAFKAGEKPAGFDEQFKRLRKMLHTVSAVRRDDHRDARLVLNEQWHELDQLKRDARKSRAQSGPDRLAILRSRIASSERTEIAVENKVTQA